MFTDFCKNAAFYLQVCQQLVGHVLPGIEDLVDVNHTAVGDVLNCGVRQSKSHIFIKDWGTN